ncbi:MAG: VOC family protein [Planctomycetes bacterium]|nr:VOC family protein [Planctomycetota bacterium]
MSSLLVHIGLRATHLEKSVRFWRDALGLSVFEAHEGWYDLTDGHHNFRLFEHDGPARPPHVSGLLDYLHIGVRVPNLSEAARRCDDLGFRIIWDGVDAGKPYDPNHPPTRSFKVVDPDGIVVDVSADRNQWPGVDIEEKVNPGSGKTT